MLLLLPVVLALLSARTNGQGWSPRVAVERVSYHECADLGLNVYHVSVLKDFREPLRGLQVMEASIEGGIYQHLLASNTAPHWSTAIGTPAVKCDSFVSFTLLERRGNDFDCTSVSPDFVLNNVTFAGSWFCNTKDDVLVSGIKVRFMQLTVAPNAVASIRLRIFTAGARSCAVWLTLGNTTDATLACDPLPDPVINYPALPNQDVATPSVLSAGAIVGIVAAVLVAALVVVCIVVAVVRRRRNFQQSRRADLATNFVAPKTRGARNEEMPRTISGFEPRNREFSTSDNDPDDGVPTQAYSDFL